MDTFVIYSKQDRKTSYISIQLINSVNSPQKSWVKWVFLKKAICPCLEIYIYNLYKYLKQRKWINNIIGSYGLYLSISASYIRDEKCIAAWFSEQKGAFGSKGYFKWEILPPSRLLKEVFETAFRCTSSFWTILLFCSLFSHNAKQRRSDSTHWRNINKGALFIVGCYFNPYNYVPWVIGLRWCYFTLRMIRTPLKTIT